MATLDLDQVQSDACTNKVACMSDRQLLIVHAQLLIDSLGGDMDIDEVLADACANKLDCMSDRQLRMVGVQLMGDASLNAGVSYGTGDPTTPPAGNGGIYYRTDTGAVWIWNPDTLSWDPVIT